MTEQVEGTAISIRGVGAPRETAPRIGSGVLQGREDFLCRLGACELAVMPSRAMLEREGGWTSSAFVRTPLCYLAVESEFVFL